MSECYYCEYSSKSKEDYEKHVTRRHPRKLCYPNKASLEQLGIEKKGKSWE
jgi:hypothetical protein